MLGYDYSFVYHWGRKITYLTLIPGDLFEAITWFLSNFKKKL